MLRRIRELKKNENGFTLIELLIVIVILGILAAVVVFAVGGFNKNGQTAACQSDYKSVEIADEAYFAKNAAYATQPSQLWPSLLKEWPQTTDGNPAHPVATPPYSIVLVAGGVAAEQGTDISTQKPDDTPCSTLG